MKAIEVGKVRESEEEVEINGMGGVGKNKTRSISYSQQP